MTATPDTLPADPAAEIIFEARLRQQGSLHRRHSAAIAVTFAAATAAAALALLRGGLWPVAVYLVVSALGLSLALRRCRQSQTSVEHVRVDRGGVTVTRDRARRPLLIGRLPLYGLTVERDIDPDFGLRACRLSVRGRSIEVARDLAPCQRSAFADGFEAALTAAHCRPLRRSRNLPA